MALSVIVTSYESPVTLRECLRSLVAQMREGEIVVSDCSRINPAAALKDEFPGVRFLYFDGPQSVPALRWAAFAKTTGDLVAITEARCIPAATWSERLKAAHGKAPESPVVGGTVSLPKGASLFDSALYFCEYGAFAPPLREGPATAVSGANLSYRREALAAAETGEWETVMHREWVASGKQLWQSQACVEFHNSMSIANALRQRWHYGRGYAADRVNGASWPVRLGLAIASLALPALLCARMARDSARKLSLLTFLRALGWILVLTVAWSAGETVGYVAGKSRTARIF